jgi:hypothetical protein
MWLCTTFGFFSIVEHAVDRDSVLVRARDADHLRAISPKTAIQVTPDRDYPYRVTMSKASLAHLLATLPEEITYTNFKDAVDTKYGSNWYARALHRVWHVIYSFAEPIRPPSRTDDRFLKEMLR